MDNRDQFERKIKDKLEQTGSPDVNEAWESFAPLLPASTAPIWKHWLMPYLYASLLFLGFLGWHELRQIQPPSPQNIQLPAVSLLDTIYRRDTIYIVDTVYVYRKVVAIESETRNSRNAFSTSIPGGENGSSINPYGSRMEEERASTNEPNPKDVPLYTQSSGGQNEFDNSKGNLDTTPHTSQSNGEKGALESNPLGEVSDQGQDRSNSTVPTEIIDEDFFKRSNKEYVVGDTSNIGQTQIPQRAKPRMYLEATTSVLLPISKLTDFYITGQQGVHLGVEWQSGWGVYLGAIRNQSKGEVDDDEIMDLNPGLVASLPNVPEDVNSIDEIYLTNRQWFFPAELRWRSPYYSGFSFESSFGILGNYLSKQDFTYEFEDGLGVEYQYGSDPVRQFSLSHVRFGIGSNYLLTRRWGLFLRSHYWLPISRHGLLEERVHGIEVNVGTSFSFGK